MITEKEIKEILLRYSTEFLGHETIDESSYYEITDDINELLVKKLIIHGVSKSFYCQTEKETGKQTDCLKQCSYCRCK